ncbi:unnamed protein product [Cyclocybe aegerita]|uniref:Uncharacterized protein n=1 Tax=Cyclocybe aegerita TaxID=1973307 RepID=A0A8S0WJ31_CYCAE|nr:unnamed protein product [Cyclocybe aegerita]
MAAWVPCPSCCPNCFISTLSSHRSSSPYALHNLLPVGTVIIDIPVASQHDICEHAHVEDGWHEFQAQQVVPQLSNAEDVAFCRGLEFLIKQRFISCTCRCTPDNRMALRVYLIPYDLANVQGKLRIRKDNILSPAKRYLRALVPKISQDIGRWNGLKPEGEDRDFIPQVQDRRTLAEIYSELASPKVTPAPDCGGISYRLLDFEDDLDGLGMRSTLYKYQRRSVAAMLQKELDLQDVPDPLYTPVKTIEGKQFYLQPGTMEVLQECPATVPCRGGILCEELGTGKTVMMLSLIVATRNQISLPEPSIVDDRPVLTRLAFRHFPSSDFSTARKRFYCDRDPRSGARVPSLVELVLHKARVTPNCNIPRSVLTKRYAHELQKEDEVSALPVGEVLRANTPFYHHYLGEPSNRERAQRKSRQRGPKVMYLTSATLVVVPANLLSQWDREITKHCAVPLHVLILRANTPMPSVRSLATDYDIILMTYNRFSRESNANDVSKLHTATACTCPEYPGYRVPKCECQHHSVSPFLQIRWKRLVIDEGHVSASLSTILVPFAKLLSVERRWIVTGTPTTNLLGLSLGSKAVENVCTVLVDEGNDEADAVSSSQRASPSCPPSRSPSATPAPTSAHDVTISASSSPPPCAKRIWTKYDREDLNKLGNMISHFIAVPQFTSDPKLIASHVIEPLLDHSGPRRGSIQVLNQVMESVMIRHRVEDVERDVVLPPVSTESVLLDLDSLSIKSFNALQAVIAINAIDSERTDQDYMFHPRNADALQETVKNLSQILFWHVDSDLYNARYLVSHADANIKRAIERNMPQEDIELLREALRHLKTALDDPLWRAIQNHEDVPYRVYNFQDRVFDIWTRTGGREPYWPPELTGFLHADRLLKLYDMILQKPLIGPEGMVEWGKAVVARDLAFRRAFEEAQRRKEGRSGSPRKKSGNKDTGEQASSTTTESLMVDTFAKKASAAETLREMQKELEATMARLAKEDEEGMDGDESLTPGQELEASSSQVGVHAQAQIRGPSRLAASSPLAKVRIGSSASSKLNYIISEVQKYSSTEKFLIFSESPLSLAHVAEALELIQVKFLRFTTQVTPQFREQLVLTFETSETYRVFLMELKHGARGLNLISASRVIFCEPVWQADVESQAIKRAHRIGQTKPITVKTLAIRETAEENMVQRRAILRNSQEKMPKLLEEAGMRHYIANPKFITHPPTVASNIDFPLIQLPPEVSLPQPGAIMLRIPALPKASPSPSSKRVRVEDPVSAGSSDAVHQVDTQEGSPLKKKRTIRFKSP